MGRPYSMTISPLEIRFLYVIDHRWIKAFTWQGTYNNRLSSLRDSDLSRNRPSVDKGFHMARCSSDSSLTPKDATSRRTCVRCARMRSLTKRDGCRTSPAGFRQSYGVEWYSHSSFLWTGSVVVEGHKISTLLESNPVVKLASVEFMASLSGITWTKLLPSPIHAIPYVVYT
jgi:hypothetical protein